MTIISEYFFSGRKWTGAKAMANQKNGFENELFFCSLVRKNETNNSKKYPLLPNEFRGCIPSQYSCSHPLIKHTHSSIPFIHFLLKNKKREDNFNLICQYQNIKNPNRQTIDFVKSLSTQAPVNKIKKALDWTRYMGQI